MQGNSLTNTLPDNSPDATISSVAGFSGQWHPKLTPYRFLVLTTTIGLGTGKAYAVSRGLSSVATTVEWIAGVVIFSIFFILDWLETNPPWYLSYLFESDLVQVICKVVSATPPNYRSDEIRAPNLRGPPINGYRLLTSLSVTLFGVTKACLAYKNLSPAANAVDWIYGVIMISCIYVLGLYEKSPLNLMPYLFSANYSHSLYKTSWLSIHLIGLFLSSLGLRFSLSLVPGASAWPSIFEPSLREGLMDFSISLIYLIPVVYLATFFVSLVGFMSVRVLDFSLDSFVLRRLRQLFHTILRQLSLLFGNHRPSGEVSEPLWSSISLIYYFLRSRIPFVLVSILTLSHIAPLMVLFLAGALHALSKNATMLFVQALFGFLLLLGFTVVGLVVLASLLVRGSPFVD